MAPSTNVSETTFTKTVPPGRDTGVYYITISNLPWLTAWIQVKDFVRTVCEVDHVEIFPGSTSGWVRVKGHENFKAAFKLLNGGNFQGRCLIADGKNEHYPVVVRDLKIAPPQPIYGGDGGRGSIAAASSTPSLTTGQSAPSVISDASQYGMTSWPTSSAYASSEANGYAPTTVSYAPVYAAVPVTPIVAMAPSMAGSYAVTAYPQSQTYYPSPALPMYSYAEDYTTGSGTYLCGPEDTIRVATGTYSSNQGGSSVQPVPVRSALPAPESKTVPTEHRKIFIRNLPHHSKEYHIRDMINDICGNDAYSSIVSLELPIGGSGKANRGHALVLFDREDTAKYAVHQLNGFELNHRKIEVRLAEPVTVRRSSRKQKPLALDATAEPFGVHGTQVDSQDDGQEVLNQRQVHTAGLIGNVGASRSPSRSVQQKKGKGHERNHDKQDDRDRNRDKDRRPDRKHSARHRGRNKEQYSDGEQPASPDKNAVVIVDGSTGMALPVRTKSSSKHRRSAA